MSDALHSETFINEGLRQNFKTLGDRNFENTVANPVLYSVNYGPGLNVRGTLYTNGTSIPFDAGASPHTAYATATLALLRRYWDQGWLTPLT